MITAAVCISVSNDCIADYKSKIYQILSFLKPPVRVIYWNGSVVKIKTFRTIDERICQFKNSSGKNPESFLKCLTALTPIKLYIFTHGQLNIQNYQIEGCLSILKNKNIHLLQVHWYHMGDETHLNLKFMDIFEGIPQTIHFNEKWIDVVKPATHNYH